MRTVDPDQLQWALFCHRRSPRTSLFDTFTQLAITVADGDDDDDGGGCEGGNAGRDLCLLAL